MKTRTALIILWVMLFAGVSSFTPVDLNSKISPNSALAAENADEAVEAPVAIPPGADASQIDAILAQLPDAQVRRLLIAELQKDAAAAQAKIEPEEQFPANFIQWVRDSVAFMRARFAYLASGARAAQVELPRTLKGMSAEGDRYSAAKEILALVLTLVAGWIFHLIYHKAIGNVRRRIAETPAEATTALKTARLFFRAVLDLGSILVFAIVTLLAFFSFADYGGLQRLILLTYLSAIVVVGLVRLVSRLILAPKVSTLRFVPLNDETAAYLHRWLMRITFIGAFGWLTCGLLAINNLSEALHLEMVAGVGLVIAFLLIYLIVKNRQPVTGALEKRWGTSQHRLQAQFAMRWHILAVVYVLVLWGFWTFSLLLFGSKAMLPGIVTLLAIPLYFLLDWAIQKILQTFFGMVRPKPQVTDLDEDEEDAPSAETEVKAADEGVTEVSEEEDRQATEGPLNLGRFYHLFKRGFRILVVAFIFFNVMRAWGLDLTVGRHLARSAFSILVTIVMGYVAWVLINAAIERRIQQAKDSGEQAAMGGNRFATLLELARKFIMVVLATMVTLIVLSSMGIDIGPLLAGAGVVGLAIGFGAQTLVKDIISGIFFLMDDAFRVGDYILTGSAKGMVERISIRSLQLRHHRGPVYTIPFGNLSQVQNMTRDWIIMKLRFRVPYDTDVDKVRKIIKKINKKIMKNEDLAPKLLGKVKSQGVQELDDSAMIMRVKFTTKPGEQFAIRKEVYKQMREAFAKAGIPFAHRQVTVNIPPPPPAPAAEADSDKKANKAKADAPASEADGQQISAGAAAEIVAALDDQKGKKAAPKGDWG